MDNQDITIREEMRSLAKRMFGNREANVFLYGSRARGTARPDSDWDILIITNNEESSSDDFERYGFPFAEIGWHHGAQITPLLYTRRQWEAEKDTAFYHAVESEAIPL